MTALVQHLHDFVKDVQLTEYEWEQGHRVPHPHRADLLGRPPGIHPALRCPRGVDAGRDDQPPRLRARHRADRPGPVPHGRITTARTRRHHRPRRRAGSPAWSPGRSRSADGSPLAGATVDVWQANAEGFYDVQQPDIQPERNLRGLFTTDDDGQVLVPHHRAAVLPHPRRRPGRRPPGRTGRHPTGRRTCTSS